MRQLTFIDAGMVCDLNSGISVGAKRRYRALEYEGHWFIFDRMTGEIVEGVVPQFRHFEREETKAWFTEREALRRLREINRVPTRADLAALDETP